MSELVLNYKYRIFFILIIGFIVIGTITAISVYSMYQYYYTNTYKDAHRIYKLFEKNIQDTQKDLHYLKLIEFDNSDENIYKSFKKNSNIILDQNIFIDRITLLKQTSTDTISYPKGNDNIVLKKEILDSINMKGELYLHSINNNNIILFYPLYKNKDDQSYKWMAAAYINYHNMIHQLKVHDPKINDFIINIYDPNITDKTIKEDIVKLIDSNFSFAQHYHKIVIGVSSIYSFEKFWQPILGFFSGLVFLALIGYYLLYKEKKEIQIVKLEMQLLKAQEISQVGHFTWNVKDEIFIISNELRDIFNLEQNEAKLEDFAVAIYKNDFKKIQSTMEELKRKTIEPDGQIEYKVISNSETKWLLTKYKAIYDNKEFRLKDIFGVTQDITEFKSRESSLRRQNEEFRKMAVMDKLTGAYNRAHFDEHLSSYIDQYKRYDKNFSIILFDIDHFKLINDNFGHDVGDDVLMKISKLVKCVIRKSDILARWGGEEFVLLLPNINLEHAVNVAQKLRSMIEHYRFNDKFTITCSFGVTQSDKEDDEKTLFKRVDQLLYKAKSQGRNKVVSDLV